jgi:hypothetical protein
MLEVHLAQVISSFYIILMFSAGMPLLYLVLFFELLIKYWVDKTWFLRLNRTPPRYGQELTDSARSKIYYGVLLHLLLGFFMYSNPDLFPDNRVFNAPPPSATSVLTSFFTTPQRFQSGHSLLYFAGGGLITLTFVLIKLISVFSHDFAQVFTDLADYTLQCVCCKKAQISFDEGFSENIYRDMSVRDLKREYQRIRQEKYRYRGKVLKGEYPESPPVTHYIECLVQKQRQIKEVLNVWLREH